jgi:hypothetical protein
MQGKKESFFGSYYFNMNKEHTSPTNKDHSVLNRTHRNSNLCSTKGQRKWEGSYLSISGVC